jgi:hypothetical protein
LEKEDMGGGAALISVACSYHIDEMCTGTPVSFPFKMEYHRSDASKNFFLKEEG